MLEVFGEVPREINLGLRRVLSGVNWWGKVMFGRKRLVLVAGETDLAPVRLSIELQLLCLDVKMFL